MSAFALRADREYAESSGVERRQAASCVDFGNEYKRRAFSQTGIILFKIFNKSTSQHCHYKFSSKMPPKGKGRGKGKRCESEQEAGMQIVTEVQVHMPDLQDEQDDPDEPDLIPETQTSSADTTPTSQRSMATSETAAVGRQMEWVRKKRVPDSLTPEEEQHLAEWFGDNPIFYDQMHRDFKDRAKRERVLAEKGEPLGISGNDLFLWFKSLRSMFGRLQKKKSGQARTNFTARQQWVFDNFAFLKSHIVIRTDHKQLGQLTVAALQEHSQSRDKLPATQSAPSDPLASGPDSDVESYGAASHHSGGEGVAVPVRKTTGKPPKKRQNTLDEALLKLVSKASANEGLSERFAEQAMKPPPTPATPSVRTMFGQWLVATAEELPSELYDEFQMEAFHLLRRLKSQQRPAGEVLRGAPPPPGLPVPGPSHHQQQYIPGPVHYPEHQLHGYLPPPPTAYPVPQANYPLPQSPAQNFTSLASPRPPLTSTSRFTRPAQPAQSHSTPALSLTSASHSSNAQCEDHVWPVAGGHC